MTQEHWTRAVFNSRGEIQNLSLWWNASGSPLSLVFRSHFEGVARFAGIFNPDIYDFYSREQIKPYVFSVMRKNLWNHEDKHEILHDRHSDEWSDNLIALGKDAANGWIDDRLEEGSLNGRQIDESIGNGSNGKILNRIIAGADWFAGEAAIALIAKAKELNRENIMQMLRNRIVTTENPVAIDAQLDAWPPMISAVKQTQEKYYESHFAFDEDKEPETSVFFTISLRDEGSLTAYRDNDRIESPVRFWLAEGETTTIRAFDAFGNASKLVLTTDSESRSTGTTEEFLGEIDDSS